MQMFEAGQIVIDLMQFPPELAIQVKPSATPSSATTSGCAAACAFSRFIEVQGQG